MNVLADTNILMRVLNLADPAHAVAQAAVNTLRQQGGVTCIVPQTLYEYWSVSTRPVAQNGRGKSPAEVADDVQFLRSDFKLLLDEPAIFDEWLTLVTTHKVVGKPSHDARLVAAMLVHGVTHILTFNDKDFRRYSQITVLTPADVVSSSGSP